MVGGRADWICGPDTHPATRPYPAGETVGEMDEGEAVGDAQQEKARELTAMYPALTHA